MNHKWIYRIWWILSDCGRSITRWFLLSLVIAIFFGLVYADIACPSWIPVYIKKILLTLNPKVHISDWTYNHWLLTPLYFSIVTFTTLGFGDVHPQNCAGLFWVSAEVIIGYIMLGGLLSIFSNKLARRS